MFETYIERLAHHGTMDDILTRLALTSSVRCGALWGSSRALTALALARRTGRPLLLVTPTSHEAEDVHGDLLALLGEETSSGAVQLFPHTEILPYEDVSPFSDIVHHRISVLHALLEGTARIVVAPVRAFLARLIPRSSFTGAQLLLRKGDLYELSDLLLYLVNLGYEQSSRVERAGEFAVKGGILDVFPSNLQDPCRIEFFDIEIESLRQFDAGSQRSLGPVESLLILPQREIMLHEENRARALAETARIFPPSPDRDGLGDLLAAGADFPGMENYLPLFFEETSSLADFFTDRPLVIAIDADETARQAAAFDRDLDEL